MKYILASLALAFSLNAAAVDYTISLTAGEATRFSAACGKAKQLLDNQKPPQPRACTADEGKTFLIERAKQLIIDVEGAALTKAAVDAIVIPAFNPQ